MTIYTIKVGLVGVTVHDGRMKGSRLRYYGGGIEVYVSGACPVCMLDKVHYHAMSLARAHHIPLTSFKRLGKL